eukprot:gene17485-23790_t
MGMGGPMPLSLNEDSNGESSSQGMLHAGAGTRAMCSTFFSPDGSYSLAPTNSRKLKGKSAKEEDLPVPKASNTSSSSALKAVKAGDGSFLKGVKDFSSFQTEHLHESLHVESQASGAAKSLQISSAEATNSRSPASASLDTKSPALEKEEQKIQLDDREREKEKQEREKMAQAMRLNSNNKSGQEAGTHSSSVRGSDMGAMSVAASDKTSKLKIDDKARSVDSGLVKQLQEALSEPTMTISVAAHCPPQLVTENWEVENFSLLRKLYEGNVSVVCQARHRESGFNVALKIFKRSRLHEMERFQLAREICLHARVLHPHIVSLYAAWKDSKYVYLALEWAPGGNLLDHLVAEGGRLSEKKAVNLAIRPLLTVLDHLHSQHFIHRDIKLENIILDGAGNTMLADFGLAIDQKFEKANTRLGTVGYFAPEILDCPLKRSPFDFKDTTVPGYDSKDTTVPGYDSKVDIWGLGVVTYELLTGSAPFSATTSAKVMDAIRKRDIKYPDSMSSDAKDYLEKALERDPKERWNAAQLLEHPWIVSNYTPPQ